MLCIVFGFLFSVFFALKGYSKIKIYSTFTHPCVVQTLYDLISSVEHKRRYFWEMWEVFFFFSIPWKSMVYNVVWFPTFSSSFVFSRRKYHTGLVKWRQHFYLWVKYRKEKSVQEHRETWRWNNTNKQSQYKPLGSGLLMWQKSSHYNSKGQVKPPHG